MSKITPPKVPVPIGRVTIGGASYDVAQHPEFVRFFFDLFRRIGGTDAMNNTDLEALILSLDDAAGRLDALGAQMGSIRAAIEALQAGEMVVQPSGADGLLPDVIQTGGFDPLATEATWAI